MVQIVKGNKGGGEGGWKWGGGRGRGRGADPISRVTILEKAFHASRILKGNINYLSCVRLSKKNWGFQKWKKKFTGHVSLLFIDLRITLAFQIKLLKGASF